MNLDVIMELQALLRTLPVGAKVTVERVVIEIPGSSPPSVCVQDRVCPPVADSNEEADFDWNGWATSVVLRTGADSTEDERVFIRSSRPLHPGAASFEMLGGTRMFRFVGAIRVAHRPAAQQLRGIS